MNIKKRIDFFAKISGRNSHANPGRIGGASDTHAMNIPCGDADATHKQRMETPIYATERLQKNIEVSANSPAEATDVNLSARVAKAIQAKMKGQSVPGESRWFLEEIGQYIPTGCVYLIGDPGSFTTFKNIYRSSLSTGVYQYYKNGEWTTLPSNQEVNVANGLLCLRAKTSSISGFVGDFTDVIGDSRYLIDYTAPQDVNHVAANQFHEPVTTSPKFDGCGLFEGCTSLVSVSKDFLPCALYSTTTGDENATTYYQSPYRKMFKGCTSLKNAPDLTATILSKECYSSMFEGCTSLEVAPTLPSLALNQANQGYQYLSMFKGCTSLKACPKLPATKLGSNCYESMFQNCTSLVESPVLTALESSEPYKASCYKSMFKGCTSLVNVGKIHDEDKSVTTTFTFASMFEGCTSLTSLPTFPHLSTASNSHQSMFSGCTSLRITSDFAVSTTGEVSANSFDGFFQGCTSLTDADLAHVKLTNPTLRKQCYKDMFKGCTGITTIPENFFPSNTVLYEECYNGMFSNCTGLTTAPLNLLPVITLATGCYKNMFNGCISLAQAPKLPAQTPAHECYAYMFIKCSNLATIYCKLSSILDSDVPSTDNSEENPSYQTYVTYKWVANGTGVTATWGVKPDGNIYLDNSEPAITKWHLTGATTTFSGVPYYSEQSGAWTEHSYPTE